MNCCSAEAAARLDKRMFEAGQQCLKRLYLDYHSPVQVDEEESRNAMSEAGLELTRLARTAFPRGIEIDEKCIDQAATQTAELLDTDNTAVLFNAAFTTDTVCVRADIVLRQKGGELDLFEVKSGMRIKARYLRDLALQVFAIENAGFRVRAVNILHLSRSYTKADEVDDDSTQLFRSVEVTERVRDQLPKTAKMVQAYRQQLHDDSALQFPTGTFCSSPFPCPHLLNCAQEEPEHPLRMLPELSRKLESELHERGINDLAEVDAADVELTFRQRQTLKAIKQDKFIVGPFVAEELKQVDYPLHFMAIAGATDVIPRFVGMRPWQQTPYAWAVQTLHEDQSSSSATFAFVDRGDPRPEFIRSLSKQLNNSGMIACWDCESLSLIRDLLESLPSEKQAVRAILSRPQLDMARLFESGLYHPSLQPRRTLASMARLIGAGLTGHDGSEELTIHDANSSYAALRKAWKPRVRATTKDKIAADVQTWLSWQAGVLVALHGRFRNFDSPDQ